MASSKKKIFSTMPLIYSIVWIFVWFRVIKPLNIQSSLLFYAILTFFLLSILLQFKRTIGLQKNISHGLWEKISYLSLNLAFWYFIFGLILDLSLLLIFYFTNYTEKSELIQNLHYFVAFLPIFLSLYGYLNVLRGLKTIHLKLNLADHKLLEPLRILQISDLHVGLFIQEKHIKKVQAQIQNLHPDMIVLTGDITDGTVDTFGKYLIPLLNTEPKHGIFFVPGNHEYYWGAQSWINFYKNHNVTCLINEGKCISLNFSDSIWIGGVTDLLAHKFIPNQVCDPEKTISDNMDHYKYKILLSHRPEKFDLAEKLGYDLMLSGHTHGGQFFPFTHLISFFNSYGSGHHLYKKMNLFVSHGAGYWGFPCRIGTRCELTLVEIN